MRTSSWVCAFRTQGAVGVKWLVAGALVALVTAAPAASFASGAVTDKNVVQQLASAKTAADYNALAAYFRKKAAEAGAKAKQHQEMLAAVSGKPLASWGPHCQEFIETYTKMQKDYEKSAAEMEAAAKDASK
jgi:hypothetical protein